MCMEKKVCAEREESEKKECEKRVENQVCMEKKVCAEREEREKVSGKGTGTEKGWKGFGERRQKKKWEEFGERIWMKEKVAEKRVVQAGLGKKPLVTGSSAQLNENKHKIIVIGYNFNRCNTL